jgi:hypothetical protein
MQHPEANAMDHKIVAEYANLVGRFGPDSEEVKDLRALHAADREFLDYADALDRMKRALGGCGIDYPAPGKEWPSSPPAPPEQIWMVVELLGHNVHAGPVTEEVRFGGAIGRVDDLQPDGSFVTIYFGHSAIFRVTRSTEAAVREMKRMRVRPVGYLTGPVLHPDDVDDDIDAEEDLDIDNFE